MAAPFLYLLLFSSVTLLKINADTITDSSSKTIHLHFYMHDTLSGSNPTAVQVTTGTKKLKGTGPFSFGSMFMIDDPLTEDPNITSNTMGRAQGFDAIVGLSGTENLLSANIVLTGSDCDGSTITIFGRNNVVDSVRELPVIGGSGKFKMARGYMLIKINSLNIAFGTAVLDVNLYVSMNSENGIIDESVPPSGGVSSNVSILLCPNYVAILVILCFLAKHLVFSI